MKYIYTLLFAFITSQVFAQGITKEQANAERVEITKQWKAEMKKRTDYVMDSIAIVTDSLKMRITAQRFGEMPEDGYSLFISLHGGGNAPTQLNDSQWQNQWYLYKPAEGLYICPRAPYDDWDMHFKPLLDDLYHELILFAVTHYKVNPDKVYILGYSAGGDGVWRLAPRMADTWAAASMMAGHPGDVSLVNLRNTPFMVWCGALDAAYDRNKKCKERIVELDSLRKADPEGYIHEGHIVAGKPHWMDQVDTVAISWMAQYKRNPYPTNIVWRQEEVLHPYFYWIGVDKDEMKRGMEVRLKVEKNNIRISQSDYKHITLYLNDEIVDLDKPVTVYLAGKKVFKGKLQRSKELLRSTLYEREDERYCFTAKIDINKK